MDKFFVIPPNDHLDLALYNGQKTLYCLAHLCLESRNKDFKKYIEFFKDKHKQGYHVILDNGAAEGDLITTEVLIELTKLIMPTEVIAPDHLYCERKTKNALIKFEHMMEDAGLLNVVAIHAVPQGDTVESFLKSYLFMLDDNLVNVIGFSKLSIPKCFSKITDSNSVSVNRIYLIKWLNQMNLLSKPIHCLGMRNITEFNNYVGLKNIRSTDSCYTVLNACYDNKVDPNIVVDVVSQTPHDYFFWQLTTKMVKIAKYNIDQLKKIIS